MNRIGLIPACIFFGLVANSGSAEPVRLAEYDASLTGASAPQSFGEMEFVLQVDLKIPLPLDGESGIGQGVMWESGQTGFIDFSASTPGFAGLAARLTDGVDDRFAIIARFRDGNQHGIIDDESALLGVAPDLVGYRIDFVRLAVTAITFKPILVGNDHGLHVDARLTYSFHGQPVPLPSTLALLALGAIVTLRRR